MLHIILIRSLFLALNLFEVSTLGQPFEVIKTQLAANRGQSMVEALKTIYSRGGVLGFYQGLIPWAWIEAGTKGAVLLFTASEFEFRARLAGASPFMVRFCVWRLRKRGEGNVPFGRTSMCNRFMCIYSLVSLVVWLVVLLKLIVPWAFVPL